MENKPQNNPKENSLQNSPGRCARLRHLICNLPNRRAAKNFILDLKLFERLAKWVDWYRTHVKFELLYLNPSRNEWTTWRSWMFFSAGLFICFKQNHYEWPIGSILSKQQQKIFCLYSRWTCSIIVIIYRQFCKPAIKHEIAQRTESYASKQPIL